MNGRRGYLLLGIAAVSIATLSGCHQMAIKPWVKPYERQHLADPIMAFDRNPVASRYLSHVYESRESARGAEGATGGGCGCN
jgi:hypothetical protein